MYDAIAYLHSYICQFEQKIAILEFKQCELEAENQRLKDQLFGPVLNDLCDQLQAQLKDHLDNQLKEKLNNHSADQKHTTPPNITYKIQELHVNELKGTLNIGITSVATTEQLHGMIEKLKPDQEYTAENMVFSQDTETP
ncbi:MULTISPECIES: spore germination protein GerPC [unclassified Paenibacillus]|uniref:spore germination protein GerPC n=1 Tax=unclassified Paenibacillus TaxID=185978 RepID=UPI003631F028